MSEIDFLVRLRDASAMILDACETRLDALAPAEVRDIDLTKIKWESMKGDKGPYEKSSDVDNTEHKRLLEYLAKHEGKVTFQGFFIWQFTNSQSIGRKPARKA